MMAVYIQVQEKLNEDRKWQATPAKLSVQDAEFQGNGLQGKLLCESC